MRSDPWKGLLSVANRARNACLGLVKAILSVPNSCLLNLLGPLMRGTTLICTGWNGRNNSATAGNRSEVSGGKELMNRVSRDDGP